MTAILKAGGGPEAMVTVMEGEALLNDASAVTLYTGEETRCLAAGRLLLELLLLPLQSTFTHHLTPSSPGAVFLEILMHSASSGIPSVPSEIWPIVKEILK